MQNHPPDLSRYAAIVQDLAARAIALAVDASPHRPKRGDHRYSLINLLPTASCLLGSGQNPADAPPVLSPNTFTDGRGQSRPIYRPYAAYLHGRATGEPIRLPAYCGGDVSLTLWHLLGELMSGRDVIQLIDDVVTAHRDSLHAQSLDEPPDHWTYRELVGLHGLHAVIEICDADENRQVPSAWRQRLIEITDYHQHHTQPDYTTYQPWGLAAFLSNPDTVMFAEQQLHDVQTHLQIEGGAGALIPALLLADAYASIGDGNV